MNLKLLIFGVFTAWIVLCTKWYVCEIQQSCYESSSIGSSPKTVVPTVTQPLAVASEPAPQTTETTVSREAVKKPDVVKTALKTERKTVTADKKTVVSEKKVVSTEKKTAKPATSRRSAPTTEQVAKSSNLTAKGGAPLVSRTEPASGRSTKQVRVEQGKNKLTICLPQQYTEKSLRTATDKYFTELARQWKKTGGKIVVTGHTDFIGSSDANYEVGMERAQNVRDMLKSKGIPASKISCTSAGEDMPRASNDTPYGRFQNRRVEVVIKK